MFQAMGKSLGLAVTAVAIVGLLAGCAAGPTSPWAEDDAKPAGFWAGLWHGALLVVTLVVSFFTDDVTIYEAHNAGVAYNIGFVLGILVVYGSGARVSAGPCKRKKQDEWDAVADQVERKIRLEIKASVGSEDEPGKTVEQRVKERLRRWLMEDEPPPPPADGPPPATET